MTILILDNSPQSIAESLDDRSLEEMIKSVAQVLCNVHDIRQERIELGLDKGNNLEIPLKYRKYKSHDPIAQWSDWCYEHVANYKRLVDFGLALCEEHRYRHHIDAFNYGYWNIMRWCDDNAPVLPIRCKELKEECRCEEMKMLPLVMPEKFKHNRTEIILDAIDGTDLNTIRSYRNYYNHLLNKADTKLVWTGREKPEWVIVKP